MRQFGSGSAKVATTNIKAITGAVVLGLLAASLASAAQPSRPNVLLIYTDDQGYGRCQRSEP